MEQAWVAGAELRSGVEKERLFCAGACGSGRGYPLVWGVAGGGMLPDREGW